MIDNKIYNYMLYVWHVQKVWKVIYKVYLWLYRGGHALVKRLQWGWMCGWVDGRVWRLKCKEGEGWRSAEIRGRVRQVKGVFIMTYRSEGLWHTTGGHLQLYWPSQALIEYPTYVSLSAFGVVIYSDGPTYRAFPMACWATLNGLHSTSCL